MLRGSSSASQTPADLAGRVLNRLGSGIPGCSLFCLKGFIREPKPPQKGTKGTTGHPRIERGIPKSSSLDFPEAHSPNPLA